MMELLWPPETIQPKDSEAHSGSAQDPGCPGRVYVRWLPLAISMGLKCPPVGLCGHYWEEVGKRLESGGLVTGHQLTGCMTSDRTLRPGLSPCFLFAASQP